MKAMVLAAGLGTRLRPLTDERPKALVELGGRTLLEIALARLRDFRVSEVIVNVHHFADQVAAYLAANGNFGMRVELSREDVLLGTGGGLKQAGWFFQQGSVPDEPFFLHNVDVLSDIDLSRLAADHARAGALATLAMQERESSRYLLFDEQLQLCGRCASTDPRPQMVRACRHPLALAFSGIHVISPVLLRMWREDDVFSIIDTYLRLAGAGEKIQAFRADRYYWRDLGTTASLAQAEDDLRNRRVR